MQGEQKRRPGRPRLYKTPGTPTVTSTGTSIGIPSPMPVSYAAPSSKEFTPPSQKRARGEGFTVITGANYTPHVLTVNAGEDVMKKIMTFCKEGSRAISITSATGTISNVTLRQPTQYGNTTTYEGRNQILSLTGLYIVNDSGGNRTRSGGMSVSLMKQDGSIFGGVLAGLFLAAAPVQVMLATFNVPQEDQETETQPKKLTVKEEVNDDKEEGEDEDKRKSVSNSDLMECSANFH